MQNGAGMKRRNAQTENEALETIDLEHVLGTEGLDYKLSWGRSGRQIQIKSCPFCGNNKYKVYVNADTGLGNCFAGSCVQGTFNKWQLLKAIFDLQPNDLRNKINRLAIEHGWRPKPIAATRYEPGALVLPNNVKVSDLYALPKYLLTRGIDPDLADYFDLRWCDRGTFKVKAPDGTEITQDYANRVLLPIYDLHGQVVSFQGRDATGTSEKRYLFPPMFASTGSHLYNINNHAEGQDTVTISEGVFDVIAVKRALAHARMDNVLPLGSFGMHFSINPNGDDQLGKLLLLKERGVKRIVFLWDNEARALEGAVEAANAIRKYGFKVYVAKLAVSKDPGEATNEEIITAITTAREVTSDLGALIMVQDFTQD